MGRVRVLVMIGRLTGWRWQWMVVGMAMAMMVVVVVVMVCLISSLDTHARAHSPPHTLPAPS